MWDYSNLPVSSEEEEIANESKIKLDMNLLLEKIDMADYSYYETLTDKEKKHFTPYTVLRWMSSLDDSVQLTYSAKKLEGIFGKWKDGGKDALNELKDEFNRSGKGTCITVAKYEHAKFDWRIKFAVQDRASADAIVEMLKEFGVTSGQEIVSLIDSDTLKYHLIFLNDFVNQDLWSMKDQPELVYQLMCSVSDMVGAQKQAHNWLPFCKGMKNVDADVYGIIRSTQNTTVATQLNEVEYRILLGGYNKQSFKKLLEDMAKTDSEITNLMKKFKSECEKYGKEY